MGDSSPQRQRILDAAVEILAAKGQGGLTVRGVAQASGYSTTGIYTWFGSKDGLLEAIFMDGFIRFRRYVAAADDSAASARERLLRSAELYWEWALANPTHYMLMFAAVPGLFTPSEATGVATVPAYEDLVARTAAYTDEDVAHHLWATVHGYTMLQIAGPPVAQELGLAYFLQGITRLLDQITPRSG